MEDMHAPLPWDCSKTQYANPNIVYDSTYKEQNRSRKTDFGSCSMYIAIRSKAISNSKFAFGMIKAETWKQIVHRTSQPTLTSV